METPKIFTKNNFGIGICECCASCKHRQLDNRTRICLAGEGAVPSNYVCGQWEMSDSYVNVGKGGGRIKKREYLLYAVDRLMEDNSAAVAAIANGRQHTRVTLAEIRNDFMKKFKTKSIYVIDR